MNWIKICVIGFVFHLAATATMHADGNLRTAQARLKEAGFYAGKITGSLDRETSTAITRYQIRHGLAINGRLDAATAKALGVEPNEKLTAPDAATWRQLRQSDEQFLERLNRRKIPPPTATPASPRAMPSMTSIPLQTSKKPMIEPHNPPPPPPDHPPAAPPTPAPASPAPAPGAHFGLEQIRDYIGAFVLAGLDPKVGAELEFFAPRVDYFGEPNTPRAKIRKDLLRYDRRWPEREFSLAGDLTITPLSTEKVTVIFPLHYDLHSASEHASGVVRKSLTLQRDAQGEWEIVAVNEEKQQPRS